MFYDIYYRKWDTVFNIVFRITLYSYTNIMIAVGKTFPDVYKLYAIMYY